MVNDLFIHSEARSLVQGLSRILAITPILGLRKSGGNFDRSFSTRSNNTLWR